MGNTYNHHCNGDYYDDDDLIINLMQLLSQYDDDYIDIRGWGSKFGRSFYQTTVCRGVTWFLTPLVLGGT